MNDLSMEARRILEHLYREKKPRDRTPGIICMGLELDGERCQALFKELIDAGLVKAQDDWQYRLTPVGVQMIERMQDDR